MTVEERLRAEGRAMRRALVGDAYADKLDRDVYQNHHMKKFAEIGQEVLFAQLWTRPGLDLKTKALATFVSDAATGQISALKLHVRFCRIQGWTEDEIVEVLLHLIQYIGVPLARRALIAATEVFDAMNAETVPETNG